MVTPSTHQLVKEWYGSSFLNLNVSWICSITYKTGSVFMLQVTTLKALAFFVSVLRLVSIRQKQIAKSSFVLSSDLSQLSSVRQGYLECTYNQSVTRAHLVSQKIVDFFISFFNNSMFYYIHSLFMFHCIGLQPWIKICCVNISI